MKSALLVMLALLLSNSVLASTFSCTSDDSMINFYFTKGKITVNENGRTAYTEKFDGLSVTLTKKESLYITDAEDYVNLDASYNNASGMYQGTLKLATHKDSYELRVKCSQVN